MRELSIAEAEGMSDFAYVTPKKRGVVQQPKAGHSPTAEQQSAMDAIKLIQDSAGQSALIEPQTREQMLAIETIREWKSDVAIRTEFGGDFKSFVHYKEAMSAGRVRICGGR